MEVVIQVTTTVLNPSSLQYKYIITIIYPLIQIFEIGVLLLQHLRLTT